MRVGCQSCKYRFRNLIFVEVSNGDRRRFATHSSLNPEQSSISVHNLLLILVVTNLSDSATGLLEQDESRLGLLKMSRSPSPASSLDFFDSDPSDEEEYRPRKSLKRRGAAAASGASAKKTTKVTLNLKAARQAAATPVPGLDEGDDFDEEEYAVVGRRGIDLSAQELVRDHEIRPLWVDDEGNM